MQKGLEDVWTPLPSTPSIMIMILSPGDLRKTKIIIFRTATLACTHGEVDGSHTNIFRHVEGKILFFCKKGHLSTLRFVDPLCTHSNSLLLCIESSKLQPS